MDIKQKILNANKIEHDNIAGDHEKCVAYYVNTQCKERYASEIKSYIPKGGDINVLELGCGTGFFCTVIPDHVRYTGIDVSALMIEQSKKYDAPNRKFICGSLEELSEEIKFDVIYSTSFLHHLYNLSEFKAELTKHLVPGGVYIALHEPIVPKRQDVLSFLDNTCAIISGSLFGNYNLFKRIIFAFSGYGRLDEYGEPAPIINITKIIKKLKNKQIDSDKYDSELVDFQLLGDFTSEINAEFNTTPYTFYINRFCKKNG